MKSNKNQLSLFLLIFAGTFTSISSLMAQAGQRYTISGFINEQGSKESLRGVVVYAVKQNVSTVSNTYGFYSLTLPADLVNI
jgi:hypothetical protein